MRRMTWLLVLLTACAGPEADPVRVAERFHALRLDGDDRGIHALLTGSDRAALPLEAFPVGLPPGLAVKVIAAGGAPLDSASLLGAGRDTAVVVLHARGTPPDTIQLRASREPLRLWRFQLDRVRWKVFMGLAERARLDSLAAAVQARAGATDSTAVAEATAYLEAAERYPAGALAPDVATARSTLRRASIAKALRVDLQVSQSFMGTPLVRGQVENPTRSRVATLRLVVRDVAGKEEPLELWDIPPGGIAAVSELTRLQTGRLVSRVERIQLY